MNLGNLNPIYERVLTKLELHQGLSTAKPRKVVCLVFAFEFSFCIFHFFFCDPLCRVRGSGVCRIAAMAAIPAPCTCVECMRPAAQAGGARTAERRAVLPARPSGPPKEGRVSVSILRQESTKWNSRSSWLRPQPTYIITINLEGGGSLRAPFLLPGSSCSFFLSRETPQAIGSQIEKRGQVETVRTGLPPTSGNGLR